MEDETNIFVSALGDVASSPGRLIFGGWEFFLSWLSSRSWLALVACAPPLVSLIGMLGFSVAGQFTSTQTLLERYMQQVDEEVVTAPREQSADNPDEAAQQLFRTETVSPASEMMLRRILQLDISNRRATYLVAAQLAKRERVGQARMMMRSIAPKGVRGFAPAHAWLAAESLSSGQVQTNQDRKTLMHDLELASSWPDVSSLLLSVYADMLVQDKRISDAITVLEKAAKHDERLWLKLASIARAQRRNDAFEFAAAKIHENLDTGLKNNTATAADFGTLSRLALLEDDIERCIELADSGLELAPDDALLRRILSEAYRIKYLQTSDVAKREFSLELLDAALKADSSNPAVTEEVAKLMVMGAQATPELLAELENKLTRGQASALTHLLLANRHLVENEFDKAIAHLEIGLRLSPNSPITLNNLAIATARHHPKDREKLARAEQLLVRAIKIAGPEAELYDSLGEVRMTAGNHVAAIECFEAAINREPERVRTRQKLAAAYRQVGLDDMADLQERFISGEQRPPSREAAGTRTDSNTDAGDGTGAELPEGDSTDSDTP